MSEQTSESNAARVTAIVWPWREPVEPSASTRSIVSILQPLIPLTVGLVFWYFGHPIPAIVLACLSALLFTLCFAAPKVYGKIERGILIFLMWVGIGLNWLLLSPIYLTFFAGAHLIRIIRKTDKLELNLDENASSYWHEHRKVDDYKRYARRQY